MSIGFTQYVRNKTHWDLTKTDDLFKLDALRLVKQDYKEFFPEFKDIPYFELKSMDVDDLRLYLVRVSKTHLLPVPHNFFLGRI